MKINFDFHVLLVIVLGLFMVFFVMESRADEESLWLTTGEWSRHDHNTDCTAWTTPQCREKYRQNNTGLGIQFNLDADSSFVAGWYNNSVHRESVYMGMTYAPWHIGGAKFGVMGAMATGYTQYGFPPAIPIASLYGSYEYERFGLNMFWLPTVVVAIQLKVKVF